MRAPPTPLSPLTRALLVGAALPVLLGAQDVPPPLSSLASSRLIVLPVQSSRSGALPEWGRALGGPRGVESALDSALANAIVERRLDANWVLPAALVRSARRNPTYATDPAAIRAGDAVRMLERQKGGTLADPAGSQLRTLVGLHDARYALVPVEVRFEPILSGSGEAPTGAGRALLHVAVLDVRGASLVWVGDVVSGAAPAPGAALLQLAERFIDLVVPR